MSSSTSTIDTGFVKGINITLPRPPVLSSDDANWDRLYLVLCHEPPYTIPEFKPPFHTLCINYGKTVKVNATMDGRSLMKNSVLSDIGIYPAGLWQSFHWSAEASFLDLYLAPSLLTQTGLELCGKECVELLPKLSCFDPLIYQISVALKMALEVDRKGSRLYADAMATALAAHLITNYSSHQLRIKQYSGGLPAQKLTQVIAYIHEYLAQDISLAELAGLVQLSPYHFARLFKQSTGMSPHRYHLQCRIDRAKQLLLERHLSITEVAHAVGFGSHGHLIYHFKQFVGATPKEFLQRQ